MCSQHEQAKEVVSDLADANGHVEIEGFHTHSSWGFLMYVTARPADYKVFRASIEQIGLQPDLKRVRKSATAWNYEVVVEVPEQWQVPQPAPDQ